MGVKLLLPPWKGIVFGSRKRIFSPAIFLSLRFHPSGRRAPLYGGVVDQAARRGQPTTTLGFGGIHRVFIVVNVLKTPIDSEVILKLHYIDIKPYKYYY